MVAAKIARPSPGIGLRDFHSGSCCDKDKESTVVAAVDRSVTLSLPPITNGWQKTSRRNAIGADTLFAVVVCDVPCEVDHPSFDEVVVRWLEQLSSVVQSGVVCHNAVDARDIDNGSLALPDHVGNKSLADSEQAHYVSLGAVKPVIGSLSFKAAPGLEPRRCLPEHRGGRTLQ